MGESDIRNAARKRLPETKLKLIDLEIAEWLIRVAALVRPKVQAAEILVVQLAWARALRKARIGLSVRKRQHLQVVLPEGVSRRDTRSKGSSV